MAIKEIIIYIFLIRIKHKYYTVNYMTQDSSMSQEIPGTLKLSIWGNLIKRLFTKVRVGCRKSKKRQCGLPTARICPRSERVEERALEPEHGGSWRGLPAKGRGCKQKEDHPRATEQGLRCPASACQQPLEAREAAAISQTSPQDTAVPWRENASHSVSLSPRGWRRWEH